MPATQPRGRGRRGHGRLAAPAGDGSSWNAALSGGSRSRGGRRADLRRTFYSSLYHALLEPRTFSDVGRQLPADGSRAAPERRRAHVLRRLLGLGRLPDPDPAPRNALPEARRRHRPTRCSTSRDGGGCLPKWSVRQRPHDGDDRRPGRPGARRHSMRSASTSTATRALRGDGRAGPSGDCEVDDPAYVRAAGRATSSDDLGYVGYERRGRASAATTRSSARPRACGARRRPPSSTRAPTSRSRVIAARSCRTGDSTGGSCRALRLLAEPVRRGRPAAIEPRLRSGRLPQRAAPTAGTASSKAPRRSTRGWSPTIRPAWPKPLGGRSAARRPARRLLLAAQHRSGLRATLSSATSRT